MSFLNKAKEQANNILNKKEVSPMGNPFLNKNKANTVSPVNTTPSTPAVPSAPTAPTVTPGVPSVPKVPGKPVPPVPGKPGIPPMPGKPGVPSAPKAPTPTAPVAPVTKDANDIANETVKEVEAKEEVKVETPVVETEVKAETPAVETEPKKEETTEAAKEEVVEKKTATKKKGGSRTSKAKTKATEEIKDAPTVSQEAVEIVVNHTELSYAEACQAIRTHFVDEEWEAAKAKFEEMSKNINISNDMNKAQLHDLLAQVANLRDEVYSAYTETKTLYEHLTDKENGMIERTKRTGAKGSNSEERKLTATIAVMNYVDGNGNKINLFEVLDETRIRYNFLKGIMDTIEFKKAVLLTMLSSLKSN